MPIVDGVLHINAFISVTFGIIVLFVGKRLNDSIPFLRNFNIPEPVTGGLLFSVVFALMHFPFGISVEFDLSTRDTLLIYFFTTIGLNAKLKDLYEGGRNLIILLVITISYMIIQNVTGVSVASLFGLSTPAGLLGGTISLIGGHGTAIAWAPKISENYGVHNAMEIGVACATFGLVLASLMGGPIAKFLISRFNLEPEESVATDVGFSKEDSEKKINHLDFLDAFLAIQLSAILGYLLNETIEEAGFQLPLFVTCLFGGIILTNIMPENVPRLLTGKRWPSRTPSMALIADISLGTFLSMSLMSMQLWTLVDLAAPILTILMIQFIVAVAVNLLIVFPLMGKTYDAAVICAGFGGISLGSTPTAMANMAAVTKHYGPSHLAFIVVPLVCSFFIDIANAIMIPFFLTNF